MAIVPNVIFIKGVKDYLIASNRMLNHRIDISSKNIFNYSIAT